MQVINSQADTPLVCCDEADLFISFYCRHHQMINTKMERFLFKCLDRLFVVRYMEFEGRMT